MPYNGINAIVGGKEKVVTSVDVYKELRRLQLDGVTTSNSKFGHEIILSLVRICRDDVLAPCRSLLNTCLIIRAKRISELVNKTFHRYLAICN